MKTSPPPSLLAAAFVISLFFQGGQDIQYAPALLCLIAGLLVPALSSSKPELPKAAPAFLLLALWVYITTSLIWSQTPFPSLVTYLIFCCFPLGFFGLLISPRRDSFIDAAMILLLFALTLLGFGAILQVTVLSARFPGRASWPLIDPNNLATLLNMGLLPMLATALTTQKKSTLTIASASALLLFGKALPPRKAAPDFCVFL